MKIGFICQPFDYFTPPDVPGAAIALLTYELARRLSRSDEVAVCVPRRGGQAERELWNHIQFNRSGLRADAWLLDRPRRLPDILDPTRKDVDSILYCPIYAARAALSLRKEHSDIIHIHNFSQFVPIARRLNPKAKIVLHMHCDWLAQFDRGMLNKRLQHADAIVGCAEYITDRVRARFLQYANRCITVHNGADVAEFSATPNRPEKQRSGTRFIFVGRVSPEKGIHVLLEAFKLVLCEHPEVELKIVGGAYIPPPSFIVDRSDDPIVQRLRRFYTSDYMAYLLNQTKTMPHNRVSFVGPVAHSELPHLLRNADVFVQPSVWGEPFPLSVIEAMAAGLPVVASRVGGLPESVVDGETGLLVERDNPAALAQAMRCLAADRKKMVTLGAAAGIRARKLFSWDAVVSRLRGVYQAISSGVPLSDAFTAAPKSRGPD